MLFPARKPTDNAPLTATPQATSPQAVPASARPAAVSLSDELAYLQDWYDRRVPLLSGVARIRQIRRALPPQAAE
ncbi:MAG: hypothetical protein POH28_09510 [Acidocella sp.]|nr:hypothetical protein [Acidocella sp.]